MLRNRTLLVLLMLYYVFKLYFFLPKGNQQTEICERVRQRILFLYSFITYIITKR